MRFSIDPEDLFAYTRRQLEMFFPDGGSLKESDWKIPFAETLLRLENCFSVIRDRYYRREGDPWFSHLHGDHYCIYLYYMANTGYRMGVPPENCEKLFLLNKALHGIDLFYSVAMPDHFLVVHPLGTVLGNGTYGDYFVVYQRCGVGSNRGVYPVFGEGCTLRPGASVLGKCHVGDGSSLGAGALLMDRDLPKGSLYLGTPGQDRVLSRHLVHPAWCPSEVELERP